MMVDTLAHAADPEYIGAVATSRAMPIAASPPPPPEYLFQVSRYSYVIGKASASADQMGK